MAKLHTKVIRALRSHLKDVQDVLDDLPGGRVAGVVISSSFVGLNHQTRQNRLSSILKQALSSDELSLVGAIAALTPAEATVKAG